MGVKDVDIEHAIRRFAERRIEEAMQEGKFDNLPGAGKPLELEPIPAQENARLNWWALRVLRQNDVVPEEVQWRKRIDLLRDRLAAARDESSVHLIARQINALVHQINTLGTNVLQQALAPVSVETELIRFRLRNANPTRAPQP